jgi:hypothetical protein
MKQTRVPIDAFQDDAMERLRQLLRGKEVRMRPLDAYVLLARLDYLAQPPAEPARCRRCHEPADQPVYGLCTRCFGQRRRELFELERDVETLRRRKQQTTG